LRISSNLNYKLYLVFGANEMRLSSKPIINFCNVNDWDSANQWCIRAGDPNTLYFQVIDLDQDGLRYIAGVGASNQPVSMQVTFSSIDSTMVVQKSAVQDPNDGSIWSFNISPTDRPHGGAVQFQLTQGSSIRTWVTLNMLCVEYPANPGCDGQLDDVNVFNFNPFSNSGTGV